MAERHRRGERAVREGGGAGRRAQDVLCCGLSAAEGLTAYDLDDAAVKKASIASSRRTILATDGSKFGRTAHAYVGPSSILHTVVTDAGAPADEVVALEAAGTVVKAV